MASEFWTETPTLKGAHVVLRPTTLDDVEGLAIAHDDPDTLRYFPFGIESEPPSRKSVEHALRSGRQMLTQVDAASGEIVGTTSLYEMSEPHRRVTIGYTWISSRARGKAINAESKLLVLEHIFGTLAARRAQLNVDDLNVRSRAAVLGLGAQQEGALRDHARRRDGSRRTTIVYSVIASEWPTVRDGLRARIADRMASAAPNPTGTS
ncbi:GNAT family N-acetyltransferase [Aldersonia sp. NBC_00410]|uniref:GNAT family N-acetyltransferase n=1 Tax=Aldersonia sp. NBC_00410 TaxID=2975954 RepID=UPI0022516FD8|nr:GNAT family protein [Aldersonia sp. NBC_00410]MCX5043425.1 GNAT family N-acetyltransferase [Aldersonia sp. NBC_00410]